VTQRLHEDEVHIDADLVRELIRAQLPQLGHLDVRLVAAPGTDNVVFRLGEELAVRLPRKPAAVASLLVEREWLRRLAAQLPLAAPEPIASGEPSDAYPFPWLVCTWVSGVPLAPGGANPNDASVLAEFVLALQSLDTAGGPQIPPGRRAGPVVAYDATARAALETVRALKTAGRLSPDLVDEKRAAVVWSAAVDAPPWHGPDVLGASRSDGQQPPDTWRSTEGRHRFRWPSGRRPCRRCDGGLPRLRLAPGPASVPR
jgi:aminoglycoside phosphotransferase (APT) family kinase protein